MRFLSVCNANVFNGMIKNVPGRWLESLMPLSSEEVAQNKM
jgi:hypothetical protein